MTAGVAVADLPSDMSLTVDENARLTLPHHGSGGYRWAVEVSGDAAGASVLYDEAADGEPVPPPGAHLGQVLVVTGLRAGDAILTLTERRPWERGPGAMPVRVHVHVRDRDADRTTTQEV